MSLFVKNLVEIFQVSWVIPKRVLWVPHYAVEVYKKGKKAKTLWDCIRLAVFCAIWMEWNRRVFEEYGCVEELLCRVSLSSSLWVSVSEEFRHYSLSWKYIYHLQCCKLLVLVQHFSTLVLRMRTSCPLSVFVVFF